MRLSSLLPFVALIPHTYAWGAVGHEIVATIAQMHLHPSVMPKLCTILHYPGECHLAPVAAWADRVRNQPKYRWTGPLHYIGAKDDYPSATCVFPGPQGWEGRTHINVLNAIRNTSSVLLEFEAAQEGEEPSYVQDALKFLIHFVGDMHQPLHLTGRNRGGNNDKVAFDGRTTNLHSVWDSLLISERIRTLPHNYTRPLPLPDVEAFLRDTIYDPYIRRIVWEGLLGKWQDELESWLDCPSSSSTIMRHQQPLASPWQIVLSPWQYVLDRLSSIIGTSDGDDPLGVDDTTLCPYAWAKPIHQLNCAVVFPKELDFVESHPLHDEGPCTCDHDDDDVYDGEEGYNAHTTRKKSPYLELYTPDYAGRIKSEWIVEKLLTQAGVRLAGVLNAIFADLDEDVRRTSLALSRIS